MLWTYRGVVNDDITGGHIAMENVLFQVLNEGSLQRKGTGEIIQFFFQHDCF